MDRVVLYLALIILTPLPSTPLSDVDWRGSYMGPVRDVGSCGGAITPFSILGALEWNVGNTTGQLIPLSAQYLVDCGVDEETGEELNRCEADIIKSDIHQIMAGQYLPYEEDYEYVASFRKGRCAAVGARDQVMRNGLADVWLHGYIPLSDDPAAIREALQSGPTINGMSVGNSFDWPSDEIVIDSSCHEQEGPHIFTFVGWQSNNGNPYYILRGNNGERKGDEGYYKYADNKKNEECAYTSHAYKLLISPRREIEYKLGQGKLSFPRARLWCQKLGNGWDLAHIPTEMHNFEVYDLFTKTFGRTRSKDKSFNFVWIGLKNKGTNAKSKKWIWVSENSDSKFANNVKYSRFEGHIHHKFGAMKKLLPLNNARRGQWTTKHVDSQLRFVCSRYREESCPRISQTSINNAYKVTFQRPGDGEETLEIVDRTKVTVTCMEGYEKKGDDGVCDGGAWRNLPACLKK